ncbi:MAG: UbiD family decarboxylase [Nitrospinota bacterium]
MPEDLRSFLEKVRASSPEEYEAVEREIDPKFEITALTEKLEQVRRRPVLELRNVKGTDYTVVTNVFAKRSRLAFALGTDVRSAVGEYERRAANPIPCKEVGTGPVKEVVQTGEAVNLLELPQIHHHSTDSGPFVTGAMAITRDPETGALNASFNRLMIKGPRKTGIHLTLAKHHWEFYQRAERRGESLPVALVLGLHPLWALGTLHVGAADEDELAVIGGLLEEPLEVVRGETVDIPIPAHAEIVIEGEIPAGVRELEGPFSEFTGYALGERMREVVEVKAVTRRKDALFHDINVAHADHMVLSTIPMEANLLQAVRAAVPSTRAVRIPAPFTAYISIEKRVEGQSMNAILAALGAEMYLKRVVVVDHDVDVFDDFRVQWAIGTRCQPHRDLFIVPSARGSDLDPSSQPDGFTSKIGIDATAKPVLKDFADRNRIPPEVMDRVRLEDFFGSSR